MNADAAPMAVTRPAGARSGWRTGLARLGVDMRPGEGLPALLLFFAFFLLVAFQYATKSVRQATYIQSLGAAMLPVGYLLVALCSYPLLRVYNRLSDRVSRLELAVATSVVSALSMGLFWWLFQWPSPVVPVLFYVWVSIVFVTMISQFWSFSTQIVDARQARRLFGFVGAGGLLGGIAGGQIARFATALGSTLDSLIVGAVLLLGSVGVLALAARIRPSGDGSARAETGKPERTEGGWTALGSSRHLRLLAALVVVSVVVGQIVDLQFNWAAERSTTSLDEATVFFGNFFSFVGFAALAFQLLFTARIHRLLGIGIALRVLPVTLGLGTVALLLVALFPGPEVVAVALALKIGDNGLRNSLDSASRELLFLPVPAAARVKAKAFIDVFVQRGAKGLGALLLLPVTFGLWSAVESAWLSLGLIALWLVVAVRVGREYVASFRRSLQSRSVDPEMAIDLSDATTLELVIRSLGSSDPRRVLHALEILDNQERGDLVLPLLLYHDDPGVRYRTLGILAAAERRDAADLVEGRLADDDPEVRARAIEVLAGLRGEEVTELMLPRMRDLDPGVRAAAVACLASHGTPEMRGEATQVLADMISDAEVRVRVEAAKAMGSVREPTFHEKLIGLLYDPDPEVVRGAVSAIQTRAERDGFNPIYAPSLISLLENRRLKQRARDALVALGEDVVPVLLHFLRDPHEARWVRRAIPKTLARISDAKVVEGLIAALPSEEDPFLRKKLLEALAALPADRKLEVPGELAETEIHRECRTYCEALVALCSCGLVDKGRVAQGGVVWSEEPSLLDELLAERMAASERNLFELLALLYPVRDVRAARATLLQGSSVARSHSLEYLDNILQGSVKRDSFQMIGDDPLAEKLRRADALFGIRPTSRAESLAGFLHHRGTGDRAKLAAAALYVVHTERLTELLDEVERLAHESSDAFTRETATWVLARSRAAPSRARAGPTPEEIDR